MSKSLFVFAFTLVTIPVFSQTEITWRALSDVTFTDKYSEEVDAFFLYPEFGQSVKQLDGMRVKIRGYILALDPAQNLYILSEFPFSSCFFCGNGGPESIIELKLKPGHPKFRMDDIVTMTGKFKLNRDDIYQCNYILLEAEVHRKE